MFWNRKSTEGAGALIPSQGACLLKTADEWLSQWKLIEDVRMMKNIVYGGLSKVAWGVNDVSEC